MEFQEFPFKIITLHGFPPIEIFPGPRSPTHRPCPGAVARGCAIAKPVAILSQVLMTWENEPAWKHVANMMQQMVENDGKCWNMLENPPICL